MTTTPTIQSAIRAKLVCVGDPATLRMRERLEQGHEGPVALFVCASAEDAQALGRWLYEDVELRVTAAPAIAVHPHLSQQDFGAPHHPAPIPKQVLELLYALQPEEIHQLTLLGSEPRSVLASGPAREAQRSLYRQGFASLVEGATSNSYEITREGRRALCLLAAIERALQELSGGA